MARLTSVHGSPTPVRAINVLTVVALLAWLVAATYAFAYLLSH
jgi:hypothetical protein